MPKKKPPPHIPTEGRGTIERSLSNPEISETGKISKNLTNNYIDNHSKEKATRRGSKKERKLSWFRRFFQRLRRKNESDENSESFQAIQKSSSCTFYTPPPADFLIAATNRGDETDKSDKKLEKEYSVPTNNQNISKPEVTGENSRSQGSFSPLIINELKTILRANDKDEGIKEENNPPEYGNVSNLIHPASNRRCSRAISNGSESIQHQFSEINELYEPTWKFQKLNPTELPTETETCDLNVTTDVALQPTRPLLAAFPKPKPPPNRRPSTRRGSKPEVIIRNNHSEENHESVVQNRRSNAELEMVIQKLSEIPAPEGCPFTPKPKIRTKFFSTPPSSPDEDLNKENLLETKTETTETICKHNLTPQIRGLEEEELQKNLIKSEKKYEIVSDEPKHDGMMSHTAGKKKSTVKRTNSFPCFKVSLKNAEDAKLVVVEAPNNTLVDETDSNNLNIETDLEPCKTLDQAFVRSKTLPPRYNWDSSGLVRHAAKSGTIVVVKDTKELFENTDGVTHLAILLQSESRPLTQDNSTQTSLRHSALVNKTEQLQCEYYSGEVSQNVTQELTTETGECEHNSQNTPPNTPEHDTENDDSDMLENDLSQHFEVASISQTRRVTTKSIFSNSQCLINSDENDKEGRLRIQSDTLETKLKQHKNHLIVNRQEEIISPSDSYSKSLLSDDRIADSQDPMRFYEISPHKSEVSLNIINSGKERPKTNPPPKPQRMNKKPPIPQKPKLQDIFLGGSQIYRTNILNSNDLTKEQNELHLGISDNKSILIHQSNLKNESHSDKSSQEIDEEESPKKKRRSQSII